MKEIKDLFINIFNIGAILIATLIASQAKSDELSTSTQLDKQNPTKWMATYNNMYRNFEGSYNSNYLLQPEELKVTTHNFGLSYKLNENYFLNVSGKYIRNDIYLKSNSSFVPNISATTEGLGDTQVGITRQWLFKNNSFLFLSANLSLPTGDYQEKTSSGRLVSYQGQLGSGTYDFAPYMAYKRRWNSFDLMTRLQGRIRMGRNDLNYRLGDEVMAISSVGWWFWKYSALTASVYYKNWREVVGSENVEAFNSKVEAANRKKMMSQTNGHGTPHRMGPPKGSTHGSGSVRPSSFNSTNTEDIFAASGARWSAQVGLKTGIFLGPIFRGIVEVGTPIYNEQIGPLTGLDTQWYLVTALQSSF
ncbi:MAG: hypothetical protein KDD58_06450 [Bdellovibrionales bacterium]|nr:hypothetical protein [Bdellovibrionales bacterium]